MSSGSFTDLASRLAEVRSLTGLDPGRGQGPQNQVASSALSRGSLVLLCAHLEGFVEDLITEALDVITASGVAVERLPLLLRALHAETHFKQIEETRDRKKRAPKVKVMFDTEARLWVAGSPVAPGMLRANTVCSEMSNPGSREMQSFLTYLDIDLKVEMVARGAEVLLHRIDGLVGKRNQIAHGEVAAAATHVDVDAYICQVEDICRHIDQIVARALQVICNSPVLPW